MRICDWSSVVCTADLVDDPLIRLVRDDPVDLPRRQSDVGHHFAEHRGEIGDGMAEHLAPLHADMADRHGRRRAAIEIAHVRIATLCMKPGREDTAIVLDLFGRQNYGPGSVAAQDARRPRIPVVDGAEIIVHSAQYMHDTQETTTG